MRARFLTLLLFLGGVGLAANALALAPPREQAAQRHAERTRSAAAEESAPTAPVPKTLRVYNWDDYIDPAVITAFEANSGLDVVYETYESNEELEAALMAGVQTYDLVVPSFMPYLARQVQSGLYRPLNPEKIPNLKNLDPALMKEVAPADPGNRHSVIYLWGTTGIGYDVDAVSARIPNPPVQSWELILNPQYLAKLEDCGVTMLDSGSEVLPIVLHYLGKDPNSDSPLDLQAATDHLEKLTPYLRALNSEDYADRLARGELCAALGWSGDIGQAKQMGADAKPSRRISYILPREGTNLWFDMMAIPAAAANPAGAELFINFLLQPQIMAQITRAAHYANALPETRKILAPEILNDPLIYPPELLRERNFTLQQASPSYERLRSKAWQKIRASVNN